MLWSKVHSLPNNPKIKNPSKKALETVAHYYLQDPKFANDGSWQEELHRMASKHTFLGRVPTVKDLSLVIYKFILKKWRLALWQAKLPNQRNLN